MVRLMMCTSNQKKAWEMAVQRAAVHTWFSSFVYSAFVNMQGQLQVMEAKLTEEEEVSHLFCFVWFSILLLQLCALKFQQVVSRTCIGNA